VVRMVIGLGCTHPRMRVGLRAASISAGSAQRGSARDGQLSLERKPNGTVIATSALFVTSERSLDDRDDVVGEAS